MNKFLTEVLGWCIIGGAAYLGYKTGQRDMELKTQEALIASMIKKGDDEEA